METDRELDRGRFLLFLGVAFFLTALPILFAVHPPFADYLNHLARIAILTRPEELGRYWERNPAFVPNLGFDYLMLGLAKLFPLAVAGKAAVLIAITAFGGGFALLYGGLYRVRSPWMASGFLLVYTYPLMVGLLNYVLGLGLMMMLIAGSLALRERPVARLALAVLGGGALAVTHLMSFVLLLLFAPAVELLMGGEGPLRTRVRSAALFAGALLLPLALTLALSPTRNEVGRLLPSNMGYKEAAVRLLPITGHAKFDYLFVLAVLAVMGYGLVRRELRRSSPALGIVGLALALWILTPYGFKTTLNVDMRLPAVVGLAVFLALAPGVMHLARGRLKWAVVAMLGLLAIRGGFLAYAFSKETRAYSEVDRALAALPPDALIICVRHKESSAWDFGRWRPVMVYAAHQAVPRGHFVSGTFDLPTQQPIIVRAEWQPIDESFPEESTDGSFTESLARVRARVAQLKAPHGPVALYIMPREGTDPKLPADVKTLASGEGWLLARLETAH